MATKICADITQFRGGGEADLVICQALLEHVKDSRAAIGAIASILKPGGVALIFLPSRNAVFARINLILPDSLRRKVCTVFPFTKRNQGFPAFYDRCTPGDFRRMAEESAWPLTCEPFIPQQLLSHFSAACGMEDVAGWRFRFFAREQAAETFSLALRKI